MNEEEHLAELFGGDDAETALPRLYLERRERQKRRANAAITRFLGTEKRASDVATVPHYYGEVLAWALARCLESARWEVERTIAYHDPKPVYCELNTAPDRRENLLMDGTLLVRRKEDRLSVTVDHVSVLVEGPARLKDDIAALVKSMKAMAKEQNFYRHQKICFCLPGCLGFLQLRGRSWESIILDPAIRQEVEANTTGFLRNTALWSRLGIPSRRGLLLVGKPGTGKTAICKALMGAAEGVTSIAATADAMEISNCIDELYDIAQDLAPSLVFIEDLDLVGRDREESSYQRAPALMTLLAALDGIEGHREIVTVATTNCSETLDKALSERPSRFDRVITLPLPTLDERRELVGRLCRTVPLDDPAQSYIAMKSEGCTPAQVQEIVYGLAIENSARLAAQQHLSLSDEELDRAVSRMSGKSSRHIGFGNGNGHGGNGVGIALSGQHD